MTVDGVVWAVLLVGSAWLLGAVVAAFVLGRVVAMRDGMDRVLPRVDPSRPTRLPRR